jgi:hypothetical protein
VPRERDPALYGVQALAAEIRAPEWATHRISVAPAPPHCEADSSPPGLELTETRNAHGRNEQLLITELIELRETITERMGQGSSLDDVDAELIDSQDQLDDDEKAALWLFAWSFVPPLRQRNEAIRLAGALMEGY